VQLVVILRLPMNADRWRARHEGGKDFLSDKPGVTTSSNWRGAQDHCRDQRIYASFTASCLSESSVYAGELVRQGAIEPSSRHQHCPTRSSRARAMQAAALRGRLVLESRQFGGILCDIGSHRWTSSFTTLAPRRLKLWRRRWPTSAIPIARASRTSRHDAARQQGLRVRTPRLVTPTLGTWGDGRLFILGTDGYIEIRKYTDVGVKHQGNNLFIADGKQARYIDCNRCRCLSVRSSWPTLSIARISRKSGRVPIAAQLVIEAQNKLRTLRCTTSKRGLKKSGRHCGARSFLPNAGYTQL